MSELMPVVDREEFRNKLRSLLEDHNNAGGVWRNGNDGKVWSTIVHYFGGVHGVARFMLEMTDVEVFETREGHSIMLTYPDGATIMIKRDKP